MPQAIRTDSISTSQAGTRAIAAETAGAFDDALEQAMGEVAAGVGGPSITTIGKTQDLRSAAQESASPRNDGGRKAKPKDLTQLSVAELSALPDPTSEAKAQLESPPARPNATPARETPREGEPGGNEAGARAKDAGGVSDGAATHSTGANPGEKTGGPHDGASGHSSPAAAPSATPRGNEPDRSSTATEKGAGVEAAKGGGAPRVEAEAGAGGTASALGVAGPSAGRQASDSGALERPGGASQQVTGVKTITGAKSKALLATLEASTRGKFVVEDEEPLAQVSRGLSLALRQGGNATLRLSPESLGDLTIYLNINGDHVTARLQPTSESARHLLESKSHELWAALEARGLSVERIEIDGSRIGQEFGSYSQDANSAPKGRAGGGPARRGHGAEPRALEVDGPVPEPGEAPIKFGHDLASFKRLRLDAIA